MFLRECPSCGKYLQYEIKRSYNRANRKKSLCRSCGVSKSRKGRFLREESHLWKGYKKMPGSFLTTLKHGALCRGYEFNITLEDIFNIYEKQGGRCNLTNRKLRWGEVGKDKGNFKYEISVDRIDNGVGYIKNNIQIVHPDVNYMKQGFSQEYFIETCKEIAMA